MQDVCRRAPAMEWKEIEEIKENITSSVRS